MPYRPNVVWFSMEDTTPRFACYGDPVAKEHGLTPNIDALAGRGRLYKQAFSTAPVCAPSRFSIITGIYAQSAGAHHMRTGHANQLTPSMPTPYEVVPPHYVRCFTEYLRTAGYYCTNNAKTDYQFNPPRSAWDDCSNNGHWRNRPDKEQPFFSVFNPTTTHESGMWREKFGHDQSEVETPIGDVEVPPYLVDTEETRKTIARQYDNIKASDATLGRLMKELEEDGLLDDTIVFLWSDHGEGLPRRKRWPLDSGTRIPLIVAAGRNVRENIPDLPGDGQVDEGVASLIDLPPTVLSLCGIEPPRHLQGRAFVGPRAAPREFAFATRDRFDEFYDMMRTVRDSRFRYVRNCQPDTPRWLWSPYGFVHPAMQDLIAAHRRGELIEAQQYLFAENRPPEELYDVEADPHEVNNLADDPAYGHDLRRLRGVLDDFLREHGDLGEEDEAHMVERFWPGRMTGAKQPQTSAPLFVPFGPDDDGTEAVVSGTRYLRTKRAIRGPVDVMIHVGAQGASVSYHTGDERWRPYTGPIRLDAGTTTLHARAHRIGHRESDETAITFEVA